MQLDDDDDQIREFILNGGDGIPVGAPSVVPLTWGLPSVPDTPWPREDGTVAPERPKQYGAEWTELVFRADELVHADPRYQFLTMVAGVANTGIESLYRMEPVKALVREMSVVSRRAAKAARELQQLWPRYKTLAEFVDRYRRDEQRVMARIRSLVTMIVAAWDRRNLIRTRQEMRQYISAVDMERNPIVVPIGVTWPEFAAQVNRHAKSVLRLRVGRDLGAVSMLTFDLRARLEAMRVIKTEPPDAAKSELERVLAWAREAMRYVASLDSIPEFETDMPTEMSIMLLGVAVLSWRRAKDAPHLVVQNGNTPVVLDNPLGGWSPAEIEDTRGPRMWTRWLSVFLEDVEARAKELVPGLTESAARRQAIANEFLMSLEVRLLWGLASGDPEPGIVRQDTRVTRAAGDEIETGREALIPAIDRFREWLGEGEGDMGLGATLPAIVEAARSDPERVDYADELGASMNLLSSAVAGIENEESDLRRRVADSVSRSILPIVEGGGPPDDDGGDDDDDDDGGGGRRGRVDPRWAMQPRFSRQVALSAPVVSAMNRAFADVVQFCSPGLVPPGIDHARVMTALMDTPVLSQEYADLVASHLANSSQLFPRQYHLQKTYERVNGLRASALMRISQWVWSVPQPYNTMQPRAASGLIFYSAAIHPATPRPPPPEPVTFGLPPPPPITVGSEAVPGAKRRRTEYTPAIDDRLMDFVMTWTESGIRDAVLQAGRAALL